MEGDFIKINNWLSPLSCLYGLGVGFRNMLFEMGVLKSRSFSVPIISVGNITVGGTGKTPHVEHLVRLLKDQSHVAVLSRGYKRKTRGFLVADSKSTASDIGDEPFQMKKKFPDLTVAVDRKRARGIDMLMKCPYDIDVVLLDDAFQHRYVKPGVNILLVDYHRLIIYDRLLPAGRLREPLSGKNRADIVIVTKCPRNLTPMNFRVITKAMDLYPYQRLYFTTLKYDDRLYLLMDEGKNSNDIRSLSSLSQQHVLLLTGIASPRQMKEDLTPIVHELTPLSFPDHHDFSPADVKRINETFEALPHPRCIVTTEKDAARIASVKGLSDDVCQHLYVLPVRIEFLLDQEDNFNQNIIGYVRKNSRNSILAKGKDDYKSKDSDHTGDRSRTISFRNY